MSDGTNTRVTPSLGLALPADGDTSRIPAVFLSSIAVSVGMYVSLGVLAQLPAEEVCSVGLAAPYSRSDL